MQKYHNKFCHCRIESTMSFSTFCSSSMTKLHENIHILVLMCKILDYIVPCSQCR